VPESVCESDEDDCDRARQDSEEMMHKMSRGKFSIEGNVFDPPQKGKSRKPDIIDKDNTLGAGRDPLMRGSCAAVAGGFASAHQAHIFFAIIPLEQR
jgi:hypothetical protein